MRPQCLTVLLVVLSWGCQNSSTQNQPQPGDKANAVKEALCSDNNASDCPPESDILQQLQGQIAALTSRVDQQDKQLTRLEGALANKKEAAVQPILKVGQLQLVDEDGGLRLALKPTATREVTLELYAGGDDTPTQWVELVGFFKSLSLVRDVMRQMPGLPGLDDETDFGMPEPVLQLLADPMPPVPPDDVPRPHVKSHPAPGTAYDRMVCKTGEYEYQILGHQLESVLSDLTALGKQARVIPNYQDGKYHGFKLVGVRPGSFYGAIGIRSGDVVHSVGETVLDSPKKALYVFDGLAKEETVQVTLFRRGKQVLLTYNVVDKLSGCTNSVLAKPQVVPGAGVSAGEELLKSEMKNRAQQFEMSVRKVGTNEYQVLSSGLKGLTPEIVTYSGTRIIPNYRDGVHVGFKLVGMRPGGIFATMGLRNGDVVQEMGGMPLNSPTALVDALQLLFDGQPQKVTFTVSRRGKPVKMTYTIVNDSADEAKEEEPEKKKEPEQKKEAPVVIQSGD